MGLELNDSGFHHPVLTEFRQRLIGHQATQLLLDRILERCQEKGLLKGTKKQRTDSTRALAKTIGRDGYVLLQDVYAEQELVEIRTLPAVETLRRIWLQQYYIEADDVQWREKKAHGFPPARKMIASPDDQDARYGSKDGIWTGYKIHLTETCERNAPRCSPGATNNGCL